MAASALLPVFVIFLLSQRFFVKGLITVHILQRSDCGKRQGQGAVTQSKAGRQAVLAKVVIDATDDDDIAANAGVPFQKGREGDRKCSR